MPDSPLFSTIRTKHAELLRQSSQGAVAPDFIKEIRKFVESVRIAGREIVNEDDRDYLRSLLTFWGNWLYNQTRTYPNTNLELFTAEAAAEYGKTVGEKIRKGEPIDKEQRSRLIIGGVTAVVVVIVAFLILGGLAVLVLPRMALPPATSPIERTVEAISTTLNAPTETPLATEAQILFTETPPPTAIGGSGGATVTPTLVIGAGGTNVAVATRTATSIVGILPTPTGFIPGATPTPTPIALPQTGGGGFVSPPVGILSVQILEPENGAVVGINEPFTISASFYNLQFGWQLFFVITRLDTAQSLVLPDSLPIQNDGATGAVSVRAAVTEPGLYTVGVFIATSQEEIQRLQRWARAGFAVPPETQYNGVILFRDLMLFEAQQNGFR